MVMTVVGCVVALLAFKLLYGWVSRPRTKVHVHIDQAPPVFYPVPVVVPQPVSRGADEPVDEGGDVELHGMIDDYYRQHGDRL